MAKNTASQKHRPTAQRNRKTALGRGLDSLIPFSTPDATEGPDKDFLLCDIELIRPNPYQPRRRFPEVELAELCDSIREQGVIQPLLVLCMRI